MSFFSSLLGGSFEDNLARAESLFSKRAYGEARLAFERALKKGKSESSTVREEIMEKINLCRRLLVKDRLDEADELFEQGYLDEVREILEDIPQICNDTDLLSKVLEKKKACEAREARLMQEESGEMTEEELMAVIAGTWSEKQSDEYAGMPESFRNAILVSHEGDHTAAIALMREAIAEVEGSRKVEYAYLELAKELAQVGEEAQSIEMIEEFLKSSADDEDAREARTESFMIKGRMLLNLKRDEEAETALSMATAEMPNSYAPYMNLGVFLRKAGKFQESLDALDKAVELMGQMHPDFRVIRERGFTCLAKGDRREAMRNLYAVVEHQASKGEHEQIDPEAAVALAKLYEESGDIRKASDLYRHLAVGHDILHHFHYNYESGRLLLALGEDSELAVKYLTRAVELASDETQKSAVEKLMTDAKE